MFDNPRVRTIDFFVLILIASAFAALGLPAADNAREAARKVQCSNNLKQLGLAMHNFHDTFNGIPPLGVGAERASFHVMLLPFMEQQNVHNSLNGGNIGEKKTVFTQPMPENWVLLSDAEKRAAASIEAFHCPSRRSSNPVQMTSAADPAYQGPVSDYCVVFIDCELNPGSLKISGAPAKDAPPVAAWKHHYDSTNVKHVELQQGLIRLASISLEAKDFSKWKPRDKWERGIDGTSCIIVVGEKHLRASEVRKYADDMKQQDGVFLFESDRGREFGVSRNIRLPLGKGHLAFDEEGEGPDDDFGFGGQHETGVNFLHADGAVKMLSFGTDPKLLNKLGHARDGFDVE